MTRSKGRFLLPAALALVASALTAATARAERRPPYGMDAAIMQLKARVTKQPVVLSFLAG